MAPSLYVATFPKTPSGGVTTDEGISTPGSSDTTGDAEEGCAEGTHTVRGSVRRRAESTHFQRVMGSLDLRVNYTVSVQRGSFPPVNITSGSTW